MELVAKKFETVEFLREEQFVAKIVFNNALNNNNAISRKTLVEISQILSTLENDDTVKIIILSSTGNVFSNGMDFRELSQKDSLDELVGFSGVYYDLLLKIASIDKVVISLVEGRVNAGGMGFIAASDIVIGNSQASFSLSEALFGLVPACVFPFLSKRIGFQKTHFMSISSNVISADKAFGIGLIDELDNNLEDTLRRLKLRILKMKPSTFGVLKRYSQEIHGLSKESKEIALDCLREISKNEQVHNDIKQFITKNKMPWETA